MVDIMIQLSVIKLKGSHTVNILGDTVNIQEKLCCGLSQTVKQNFNFGLYMPCITVKSTVVSICVVGIFLVRVRLIAKKVTRAYTDSITG